MQRTRPYNSFSFELSTFSLTLLAAFFSIHLFYVLYQEAIQIKQA